MKINMDGDSWKALRENGVTSFDEEFRWPEGTKEISSYTREDGSIFIQYGWMLPDRQVILCDTVHHMYRYGGRAVDQRAEYSDALRKLKWD